MKTEKLSEKWIFERHSKTEVKEWINNLKYFFFKRAWGGHANDGDEFQTAFLFTNKEDLISKIEKLGLKFNTIPDDYPRPILGKSYSVDEFKKFKSEIQLFPNLEQPGHCNIFGKNAFIWIQQKSITIIVSGTKNNPYEVTQEDFEVCRKLE